MSRFLQMACFCALINFMALVTVEAGDEPFLINTSYKSLLSNPEQTGMLDGLMHEAFRRIGARVEIVFAPTERSLVDANAGLVDGELNRIQGMEADFPNLVRIPEPNMVMDFVAFAREPFPIDGWESLRELDVGIVRGWKILENNTKGFPRVVLVPTEIELFSMLQRGRIDVALYDKLTGYEQLSLRGIEGIRHLKPPLVSREMFLYLHVKHEHLVDQVAKALRDMKADGAYDRIVKEATAHLEMNGK